MEKSVNIAEIKKRLEQLVSRSCLKEAVNVLMELADVEGKLERELRNEIIALSEKYTRLEKLERQGLLKKYDVWLRWNEIVWQVLKIKDELDAREGIG